MDKFIEKFKKGTQYVNVVSPITANESTSVNGVSDDYLNKKCVKLIPASGAATRMFKDLYGYLCGETKMDSVDSFLTT